MRTCFICRSEADGVFCATCMDDLSYLGIEKENLPAADATEEDVRAWAKKNDVSMFSCGRTPS